MTLDVVVLYAESCPNYRTTLERVHAAAEQTGLAVEVRTQAVETDEDAARFGSTGSPTILVGGRDPFSPPGAPAALTCGQAHCQGAPPE